MEANQSLALEKHLKRITNLTFCLQAFWVSILGGLFFLCSDDLFPKFGQLLSAIALISSFVLSRKYIKKGKELEQIRTFSPREIAAKKREYFTHYFSFYPIWTFLFIYFS